MANNNNSRREWLVASKEEAIAALKALAASGAYDTADALLFVDAVGIVPDWLNSYRRDDWIVRHCGQLSRTTAIGERDAINKVRFSIYGRVRECDCPPFDAVCPYNIVSDAVASVRGVARREDEERTTVEDLFGRRKISKGDALLRLRKMAS